MATLKNLAKYSGPIFLGASILAGLAIRKLEKAKNERRKGSHSR